MPRVVNSRLYKPLTIENVKMSHATVLPEQVEYVEFDVQDDDGVLVDLTSASIVVRDPANSTRVLYDVANLTHVTTGKYIYKFTVPSDVVEGDWYVNISVTVGTDTTVRNVHFEVEEV